LAEATDGGLIVTVGEVVSIVSASAPEVGPTFPNASVALAVMLCKPSVSTLEVIVYVPPLTTPLPICVTPSNNFTVIGGVGPAGIVPVNVGALILVLLSVAETPESWPAASAGVEGGEFATVKDVLEAVACAGLPAPSVAVPATSEMLSEPVPVMLVIVTVRVLFPDPLTLTTPAAVPVAFNTTLLAASVIALIPEGDVPGSE
jgi:hypothetical protein